MGKSERKTLPVVPPFRVHPKLKQEIADVIERSIDHEGQMPLFPDDIDIEDLRVPVEQAERVRENVLRVLNGRGFDIEIRDDAFRIIHAPDLEEREDEIRKISRVA